MTDKELRKLGRRELLEMLTAMRRQLDELKSENEQLKEQLNGDDLLSQTARRVKRLYEDRFGADLQDENGSTAGSGE